MTDNKHEESQLLCDFYLSEEDLSNEAKQLFPFHTDILDSLTFYGRTVLNNENLTSGGRHILCSQIIHKHETIKSVLNYLASTPLKSKEKINDVPTIIICGLPRTGTTLLYNLMACDPASRAPLLTDMSMLPIPPILRSNVDEHKRRMEIEGFRLMQVFQSAGCDFQLYWKNLVSSHPIFPIEEDVALLANADLKIVLCNLVSKHDNLVTHFTDRQKNNYSYDYHRTVLQMLHDVDPPRGHWLLKSPVHTLWIDTLLKYYPQVSLIMSHRRLGEVVPSACRIALALSSIYIKEDDLASLKIAVEQTIALLDIWIERLIEFRIRQPSLKNIFDIQYDDLMRDPIGTVRRIYNHFDFLQWSDDFEKAMGSWLINNPQGKQGRHLYSLDKFGVDKDNTKELHQKYEKMFLSA